MAERDGTAIGAPLTPSGEGAVARLERPAPGVEAQGMASTALRGGTRRAPEPPWETERIARLVDLDRRGRHAEPDWDLPIYDALRAELAAVDWFSLGAP